MRFNGVVDNYGPGFYGAGLYNTMHWFDNNSVVTSYIEPIQTTAKQNDAEFRFGTDTTIPYNDPLNGGNGLVGNGPCDVGP